MNVETLPIFAELEADLRHAVAAMAHRRDLASGEILFYEGDPAVDVVVLISGEMSLTTQTNPDGTAITGEVVDLAASLGGLAHTVRATATGVCEIVWWPASDLWLVPGFDTSARRALGRSLRVAETRLAEVAAPVHYSAGARIAAGPFAFDNTTLLIAFCDARKDAIEALIPDGLHLLASPSAGRAPIFIGLADFPDAHPELDPMARFAYTETTFFIPVRCGANPGVFIPYIYPSAWEPILIGREVYGFPKQLGHTVFGPNSASLSVDSKLQVQLTWVGLGSAGEPQLVGALMAWLGIERHMAAAAFQLGDGMRAAVGLPPHRRVDVYSHKQVLAADGGGEIQKFAVGHLVHAVFGVRRWAGISRMIDPLLAVEAGPLAGAELTLREAYRTKLDLRLSVAEMV